MGYAVAYRVEVAGLKEFNKFLAGLGVPDALISEALNKAGQPLAVKIRELAPKGATGKLAASVKVNKAKSELRITVGNNTTVKHAYPFHAVKLGTSKGYLTYTVTARGNRAGYSRVAKVRDYPFAYIAAEAEGSKVMQAAIDALSALARSAPSATGVI